MPAFTYAVEDLPPDARASAFTPVAPGFSPPTSSWGLVHITGAPGTFAVPAPMPPTSRNRSGQPCVDGATVQPSLDSPEVRFPWLYVVGTEYMGPQQGAAGVLVQHHEDMPVPAIWYRRVATTAQRQQPTTIPRGVTPWPFAFQRFRDLITGRSGG